MTLDVKKAYSTTMTSRCTAAREMYRMGTKPHKKKAHRHTCSRDEHQGLCSSLVASLAGPADVHH